MLQKCFEVGVFSCCCSREHLEQLEFILRCFCASGVGRWMDFLPQQLWELVAMSKDCHHHASVDIAVIHP